MAKNQREPETLEDIKKALASLAEDQGGEDKEVDKLEMLTIKFNLCKDKGEPLDESDLSEVMADGKFEGK